MAIDHLNPPTGQMADNVIGFARALRAAGIPVGPGAVIDALNALQVIEIGNRADVFTTLEIDLRQAPRACADLRAGLRAVLPRRRGVEAHAGFGAAAGSRQEKAEAGLAPGPGGAVAAADERDAAGPGKGAQAFGLRQGSAAEEGFRADERGRDRSSHPRHRQDETAAGRIAHPPLPAGSAGPAARHAPHLARQSCAPAATSSISIGSGGSTSRRRSWRCWISRDR